MTATSSTAGARSKPRSGGPAPRTGAKRTLIGKITQIPSYLRLMAGLVTDPRVPTLDKVLLGVAIAYVVSPIDLIPDFIPFLGQVDDVFVLVLAVRRLITNAGMRVVRDHWDGAVEDLHPTALQEVIVSAAFFLPRGIRRRLRKIAR
ncbi:MAG: YkvA family protein [Gemmatimonadota bacterium]